MSPPLGRDAAAYLEQAEAVADWLAGLDPADFGRPSTLPGWSVHTLAAHVLGVVQGMLRLAGRPTDAAGLPPHEFVRHYRRDVAALERFTAEVRDSTPAEGLAAELRAVLASTRERFADPLPAVVDTPRGPTTTGDFVRTRVVELVVHADDLSRSLPERDAVSMPRTALASAVRTLAEVLAAQAPGRSVELRVPPFVAVQAVAGPRHTRGTPPNVVETDPLTWLRLATGRTGFAEQVAGGAVHATGPRSDLAEYLPVLS